MKAPVCSGGVYTLLRLGLLGLIFICVAYSPAAAQSCTGSNCVVIFAGDDNSGNCFTTNRSEVSCPVYSPLNTLTTHILFGMTVDFFEPSNITLFGAHTATSGPCCSGTNNFFRAPASGFMATLTDYTVTFDGHPTAGGNLNAGTYNYYCEPHGSMMKGVLIVDQAHTSVGISADINPAVVNQTVTFTVTVTNTDSTGVPPSGNIQLFDGGIAITAPLSISGSRPVQTQFSVGGHHSITAVFTDPVGNFASSNTNSSPLVEDVHNFTLVPPSDTSASVLPTQTATYTGTLSSLGGYTGTINLSCQGNPAPLPTTCGGTPVSLPADGSAPFTVTASNNSVGNFTFNIVASGPEGLSQSFGATLSVGSFVFSALNPTTATAAQGSPSSAMAFQINSPSSFSGEVDMDCPTVSPPAAVSCIFSNGAPAQAFSLAAGQTLSGALALSTTGAVTPGSYAVTVRAMPKGFPSQAQPHTATLTVTNGGGLRADAYLYFGNSPDGSAKNAKNPPSLVGIGSRFTFDISAFNNSSNDSHNVNITLFFAQPFVNASGVITRPTGGGMCTVVSSVQVNCLLGTVTAAAPFIKTVTFNVVPFFGRSVDFVAILTENETNMATPTTLTYSVKVRYRPMLRPALRPGNTNPK